MIAVRLGFWTPPESPPTNVGGESKGIPPCRAGEKKGGFLIMGFNFLLEVPPPESPPSLREGG